MKLIDLNKASIRTVSKPVSDDVEVASVSKAPHGCRRVPRAPESSYFLLKEEERRFDCQSNPSDAFQNRQTLKKCL